MISSFLFRSVRMHTFSISNCCICVYGVDCCTILYSKWDKIFLCDLFYHINIIINAIFSFYPIWSLYLPPTPLYTFNTAVLGCFVFLPLKDKGKPHIPAWENRYQKRIPGIRNWYYQPILSNIFGDLCHFPLHFHTLFHTGVVPSNEKWT